MSLSLSYNMSPASVNNIIMETTKAISHVLKPKVFPVINEEMFSEVERGFRNKWNFPNCIGAIDGKHVVMKVIFQ